MRLSLRLDRDTRTTQIWHFLSIIVRYEVSLNYVYVQDIVSLSLAFHMYMVLEAK